MKFESKFNVGDRFKHIFGNENSKTITITNVTCECTIAGDIYVYYSFDNHEGMFETTITKLYDKLPIQESQNDR